MGRQSKRGTNGIGTKSGGQTKKQRIKCYRAGIYARLSSDQDTRALKSESKALKSESKALKGESKALKSESLEVQIEIAEKYVEDWNQHHGDKIEIIERYTDLGKTGTNFDREAFKQLMNDVRLGDINCVIVKDLSRFGRNYLEAGNYIEKIFPFLGVRFIAVADGYDTGVNGNHARQMGSEIKNLVNDMYAKDFSAKAKLSLKQRREDGSYVGGMPPYGYEAYWEGRIRKLRPDGNTAAIVRRIYEKFLETESYQAVADYLNSCRINPPAVYQKQKEVYYQKQGQFSVIECGTEDAPSYCPPEAGYKGWDRGAVERILKSETYTGELVQGRTSITARKEENRVRKPEDEWVRRACSHEALVPTAMYWQAAEIRRKIRERTAGKGHPTAGCPIAENSFDQVLYCGVCGRKMTRNSYVKQYKDGRRERKDGYFCLDSIGTKTDHCPVSNRISGMELADILSVVFQKEFSTQLKKRKDYVEQGRGLIQQKQAELEGKWNQTQKRMSVLAEEECEKYMAYRMGKLTQEEYVRYRLWKEDSLVELEKQKKHYLEEIKKLERKGEDYLRAVRALIKLKSQKELTKELIEALIERIYIYPGKRVEVVFAYTDVLTKGVARHE